MNAYTTGLRLMLLTGETRLLRFWFGLMGIFFSVFLVSSADDRWEYKLTFAVLPAGVWAATFICNGIALIYGSITSHYNPIAFLFEDILGVLAWTALSITSMISQGSIGGITVAALINIYLLMRYPAWK